jgi:hypothetical protein
MLEIPRHECCGVDKLALAGLGRGMVDLEHAKPGVTPGKRVQARAQDHVLVGVRSGQPVLGESRTRGHPRREHRRAVAEHHP